MATIGATVLTLADWAKRLDPNGKVPTIVELLSVTNEILSDMLFKEGNLPTGDRVTVRTGLPTVYWRLLNTGVPSSKSTTAQVDEQCGMLEARSEVDKDAAELNGNVGQYRLSEAQAFLEAMNQEMASTLFYGNAGTDPEEFTGLAPRYSDLGAASGDNIIDASGTGSDNTSIWLVSWGPLTTYGIFPKASKAGLIHEDLGIGDAFDSSDDRFRAYMDRWQWKLGLCVRDWRYNVRIANIDVSDLIANSSPTDLIAHLIFATHLLPSQNMGKACLYMNRTVFHWLDIQRREDVFGAGGSYVDVDGKRTPNFRGIPIRICDGLLETESRVT